ncbi:hypothetical protein GGS21DRAFT_494513 [Xylaria nigripes]|nr:hypothetical protein GGS21DRAFT_494513 [Xylaria nigripes]
MAPLCKFYQRGDCRNGANCRFEHPGANTSAGSFGSNRFNAFNSTSAKPQDATNPYKLTRDTIRVDLAEERPTWIFSCYGPGKAAPEQLFGGYPREQSLEEVMLYIRGSANQQQAISEVTALYNQAEQQIQTTLGNLDSAVDFVLAAENKHPNRNDICKQNTNEGGTTGIFSVKTGFVDNPLTSNTTANQNSFSTTQPSPFGGGTSAFGQPSNLGPKLSAFGAALPSQFGQPSQMGSVAPAFGQSSQLGAAAPAFGQQSQMSASGPAFGQTTALGQRPSLFAAASTTAPSGFTQVGQSAFGQPSMVGQTPRPFGALANPTANSFGQQSSAPIGSSPFGQVSETASTASPFGQVAAPNPFSSSMDTSGPSPATSNPFGPQPNMNSDPGVQPHNPFGTPMSGVAVGALNPFGQTPANTQPAPTAPAPPAKSSPYAPGSAKQHPPIDSYLKKTKDGQLMAFNNQPIVYKWKVNDKYQDQPPPNPNVDQQAPGIRKPDGTWCKILFPNGPPVYNRDTEPEATHYDTNVKAAYAQMSASGRFQSDVPEVPPMREDCIWTF